MLSPDISSVENSVYPDQLASEEASWSECTLFFLLLVNSSYAAMGESFQGCSWILDFKGDFQATKYWIRQIMMHTG